MTLPHDVHLGHCSSDFSLLEGPATCLGASESFGPSHSSRPASSQQAPIYGLDRQRVCSVAADPRVLLLSPFQPCFSQTCRDPSDVSCWVAAAILQWTQPSMRSSNEGYACHLLLQPHGMITQSAASSPGCAARCSKHLQDLAWTAAVMAQ